MYIPVCSSCLIKSRLTNQIYMDAPPFIVPRTDWLVRLYTCVDTSNGLALQKVSSVDLASPMTLQKHRSVDKITPYLHHIYWSQMANLSSCWTSYLDKTANIEFTVYPMHSLKLSTHAHREDNLQILMLRLLGSPCGMRAHAGLGGSIAPLIPCAQPPEPRNWYM